MEILGYYTISYNSAAAFQRNSYKFINSSLRVVGRGGGGITPIIGTRGEKRPHFVGLI